MLKYVEDSQALPTRTVEKKRLKTKNRYLAHPFSLEDYAWFKGQKILIWERVPCLFKIWEINHYRLICTIMNGLKKVYLILNCRFYSIARCTHRTVCPESGRNDIFYVETSSRYTQTIAVSSANRSIRCSRSDSEGRLLKTRKPENKKTRKPENYGWWMIRNF